MLIIRYVGKAKRDIELVAVETLAVGISIVVDKEKKE